MIKNRIRTKEAGSFTRMFVCNYGCKLNCEPKITKTPKGKSTGLPSPLDLCLKKLERKAGVKMNRLEP